MWNCHICNHSNDSSSCVCAFCGFDDSVDYFYHPTLSPAVPPYDPALMPRPDPAECYFLGCSLMEGNELPRNSERALQWFVSAAEAGYSPAVKALQKCIEDGMHVPLPPERLRILLGRKKPGNSPFFKPGDLKL